MIGTRKLKLIITGKMAAILLDEKIRNILSLLRMKAINPFLANLLLPTQMNWTFMKQNICTLEKLMLLTWKNQINLLHLRMMNGLSNSHVAKIEKPLNNVSVEIVVLQTISLQTVLPTNAIDVQNWVIFLLNALDKPQDVLLALLARTLIIYIKTVQTMSAEDAVHWDTLKPTALSLPGKDKT